MIRLIRVDLRSSAVSPSVLVFSASVSAPRRLCGCISLLSAERRYRSLERRQRDAVFGDDGGDQVGWRDVEGGVVDVDVFRGGRALAELGDFGRRALFDR